MRLHISQLVGALCVATSLAAVCRSQTVSGPNVIDTLNYINTATPQLNFVRGYTPLSISSDGTKLHVAGKLDSGYSFDYWTDVRQLNPTTVRTEGAGPGLDWVLIECINHQKCVDMHDHFYHDDDNYDDTFRLLFASDPDKNQRVARALGHLIILLQAQYKQLHSDPNDPFAKPQ